MIGNSAYDFIGAKSPGHQTPLRLPARKADPDVSEHQRTRTSVPRTQGSQVERLHSEGDLSFNRAR